MDSASVFDDAKKMRFKRAVRQSRNGRLFELDISSILDDGVLVTARMTLKEPRLATVSGVIDRQVRHLRRPIDDLLDV